MAFELNLNNKKAFIIDVITSAGKQPSFGINTEKTFVNNLCVDSNGKGLYKRISRTRTLNIYLVKDLLEGKMKTNDLDNYFENMEIVNAPNLCTHNFITDKNGNVWIIEPGRGNIKNKINESQYYIMTNFSLVDYNAGKKYNDNGSDRYMKVKNYLDKNKNISVNDAFNILEEVKQTGEWSTDFSFVYSKNYNKIYYCYNSDFKNILEYKL
ncbi:hypothetical protein [Treponema sp. R8-4-B8]